MFVDDGTECKSISEWGWHVLYFHIGVTCACGAAPLLYSLRGCHFLGEIWHVGWLNMSLYKLEEIKFNCLALRRKQETKPAFTLQLVFVVAANLRPDLCIELVKQQEGSYIVPITLSNKNKKGAHACRATSPCFSVSATITVSVCHSRQLFTTSLQRATWKHLQWSDDDSWSIS